jgi:hypothetical protein
MATQGGGIDVVTRAVNRQVLCARDEASEISESALVTSSREQFHDDDVGRRDRLTITE